MLRYLIFKLILYFRGIRFFKTDIDPSSVEFRKAEFKTFGEHQIQFLFYREILEDIRFKRGKITKERFHCYIIQSRFDPSLPEDIVKFNNLKFMFNARNIFMKDEDKICEVLLSLYLDFIKHEQLKK